jgi:hypothetical protein
MASVKKFLRLVTVLEIFNLAINENYYGALKTQNKINNNKNLRSLEPSPGESGSLGVGEVLDNLIFHNLHRHFWCKMELQITAFDSQSR